MNFMPHWKKSFLFLVIVIAASTMAFRAQAATLAGRLGGHILLQVEEKGEAWYVDPETDSRFYMGRPSDAYDLMREFGLGIDHNLLMDYVVSRFPARLAGKILLDVHWNGEAYYVNPDDLNGYYLGRPGDAFLLMRQLGLGISNGDLENIPMGMGSGQPPSGKNANSETVISTNYNIVDTRQSHCFDETSAIDCPEPSEEFFGQDAQYAGNQPSYTDNGNGTVTDNVTGLMWQQEHNERLNYADAKLTCDWLTLGGYYDWRLPTIKELYSLSDWRGLTGEIDYIDNEYFNLEWPDESILENDPEDTHWPGMMGQTWSSTVYAGHLWDRNDEAAFFFNFLDGSIKSTGTDQGELFYRCVRGPEYGVNDLEDNGDGTVTDHATELTWQRADDGQTRNWSDALAYCENLELAEADDWRLPNVKELQSIVNYDSPEPAKYPDFEQGDPAAWYWSSTTSEYGSEAAYICFGECTSEDDVDVHGAGAQRTDPKSGNAAEHTGRGGQNDEVRIMNHVRCVRGGATLTSNTSDPESSPVQPEEQEQRDPSLPTEEAITACEGFTKGAGCYTPDDETGSCQIHPEVGLFCKPQ